MKDTTIRIGTRSSELAMWQANLVQSQLLDLGYESEIIKIDSKGDAVLDKPLYELGIVGVFTRNLDLAMLNGEIDIAVHSLKDVPTILPKGIVQAAVLERASYGDIIVWKGNTEFMSSKTAVIATGSLRRKAQWLNRYPEHTIVGLRGNVNTRLKKLEDNDWNGAIFAAAGLERIKKLPRDHARLSWMVPAPAQGVVMITALQKDTDVLEVCKQLNHEASEICANIEREFLNTLEGGCTAPIGALAKIIDEEDKEKEINFIGVLCSLDGNLKIEVSKTVKLQYADGLGKLCAKELLSKGGQKLLLKEGLIENHQYKVFSTRELSSKQIESLSDKIKLDSSDFIRTKYNRLKPSIVKKDFKHVVITSQNAVLSLLHNFGSEDLKFENIYCVGRRTKRLVEKKIGKVTQVENTAEKLADFLVENINNNEEITFFCGDLRRDALPNKLLNNSKNFIEIVVYTTQITPSKLSDVPNGILFFSPSAIESYLSVNNTTDITAFCIGETTAAKAKRHFNNVKTAKIPTVEKVIELVNKTLK
ncbi:MAG: hydroxymethylbilane synthase [Flavobacteriaceae bacterium]|nr:hydroxymethylbilane synthase [Flavobacteriaceae bacterium]